MKIPNLSTVIKYFVPEILKEKVKDHLGVPSQAKSFKKFRKMGFSPEVVLDIGAYEGNWAKDFKKIFPDSQILMFEAQTSKEDCLSKLCKKIPGLSYQIELLGCSEQQVEFNLYETASSVLKEHHSTGARVEQRTMVQLDHLLANTAYSKPDMVKIDTQGYELEILKGAEQTLSNASAVLLEVSLIDIYKNVPLVDEVMLFMKIRGFVLFDICSLIYRPLDEALYQSDFLFVKSGLFARNSKIWS